jgi:hypothetical protein
MNIPAELLLAVVAKKGGAFLETGRYSGEWRKDGQLIATWSRGKNKKAVVTWHTETVK